MTSTILVTGGLGYIGSHMAILLKEQGHDVVILDRATTTASETIIQELGISLITGDVGDRSCLRNIFTTYPITAVMHFAGEVSVAESVQNPALYYQANVINTITLLEEMRSHHIALFIFSSTAAIFGEPVSLPIEEDHPIRPVSPYGNSKAMVEQLLQDYKQAYGFTFGALRYFNASGSHPNLPLGESHEPETHLIPLILQAMSKRKKSITVFGTDYPTQDGAAIRDYIHVMDLCKAHLLLLQYLENGGEESFFNLGLGQGFSVLEVIEVAKHVTNCPIEVQYANRRQGDPAILIASGDKAKKLLKWKPDYTDLATIIAHAWKWEQIVASHKVS